MVPTTGPSCFPNEACAALQEAEMIPIVSSKWMENMNLPRQIKPTDTEKITINLGYVDLGRIDLLVEEGFYTNRTDFIRSAIRAQLSTHAAEVGQLIERRTLDVGLRDVRRADLEAARDCG
jgi:Arc/MetJ-type ribon-helix-helix transcriptional regulator